MTLAITHYTATCATGDGLDALRCALRERTSGLRPNDFDGCDLDTWIGRVPGLESTALPDALAHLDSRNNRLAWRGLQQDGFQQAVLALRDRLAAGRIGVAIGTSTSSIGETEKAFGRLDDEQRFPPAFRKPAVHNPHSPSLLVQQALELSGPALTISTACSSSAKVFASAARWLHSGLVDAVVVGGVDTLCLSVLYGFHSLGLVADSPCRPFDERRNGINLGEAAAFALLRRAEDAPQAQILLRGYGESTDAHHMSHPHPDGLGAALAMDRALSMSGLAADDIDYLNLHGTASGANDPIEAAVVAERFPRSAWAASTKGWTGHTLGAAGALEAIIAMDALVQDCQPGTLNSGQLDPAVSFPIAFENRAERARASLTNSFGFGGNNCCLVFAHA